MSSGKWGPSCLAINVLTHADRASWAIKVRDIAELIFEIAMLEFEKLCVSLERVRTTSFRNVSRGYSYQLKCYLKIFHIVVPLQGKSSGHCISPIIRDHFVYAPIQWEMMLHCNIISDWMGTYTKVYAPIQWEMMLHCNIISDWMGTYTKVYVPIQWEMMLHCNIISDWMGTYTKWFLHNGSVMWSFEFTFVVSLGPNIFILHSEHILQLNI